MTTRSVALLRGINVGGNKRVAMADLRDLLGDLGYTDVATLLQSGNAVFTSSAVAARSAARDIEQALIDKVGVQSTVIIRSAVELTEVVARAPMLDVMTDPARYLVGFLGGEPDPERVRTLASLDIAPDRIQVIGRELYQWAPAGVAASPVSKVSLDRMLGVAVTMRNWNTVNKLIGMLTT